MIIETGTALATILINLWNSFIIVLPGIIAAIVVLIVGYILGVFLGYVVRKSLVKVNIFAKLSKKTSFSKLEGKFDFPRFLGLIVKWYVIILFLSPAAGLIKLEGISTLLNNLAMWIPNLIVAIVIGVAGFIAAEYIELKIKEIRAKSGHVIGPIAKIIVLIFTAIIALKQIGIDIGVAENSFMIILGGIMLALAIGFGLALKDEAKLIIKDLKKRI